MTTALVHDSQSDAVLARLINAHRLLAQARDVGDVKQIVDIARAAEVYAQRQKLAVESIRYATSIKIDAMKHLGDMLTIAEKNKAFPVQLSLTPRGNR